MTQSRVRDAGSGLLFRPASALLAHERFAAARGRYIDGLLALYGDDPFLSQMMGEAARAVLFGLVICLHVDYRAEDRDTWPILANIQRILQTYGLSSPRRIEMLIARLVQVGYIDAAPAPGDRRVRLLRPSEPMLAHDREWLAVHYAPLALLYPDDDAYALPLARDPAFHREQRRASARTITHSARALVTNEAVMLFGSHNAGFLIVAALAAAAADAPDGVARLPIAEIARRFGVSRAHVRRMLGAAEQSGLVAAEAGTDRAWRLAPPMWHAIDRFIADALERHDLTGRMALAALAR